MGACEHLSDRDGTAYLATLLVAAVRDHPNIRRFGWYSRRPITEVKLYI